MGGLTHQIRYCTLVKSAVLQKVQSNGVYSCTIETYKHMILDAPGHLLLHTGPHALDFYFSPEVPRKKSIQTHKYSLAGQFSWSD